MLKSMTLFLTAAFEPLLTRHKASSSWVHKPFTDFIESQITLSGPPEISSIIVNPQFSLTSPILQSETHKQGPHGQTHTPLGVQPCCEVWLPRAKHLKSLASGPHHCFHTCSAVVMMFNKSLVASVDPVMGISLLGQQGCLYHTGTCCCCLSLLVPLADWDLKQGWEAWAQAWI